MHSGLKTQSQEKQAEDKSKCATQMRSWLQTVSQAATPLDLGSRLSSEFGAWAASKAAPDCRLHSGLKTQSQEKQAEDKSKCAAQMRSWLQTVSQAATPLDLGSRLSSEFGA